MSNQPFSSIFAGRMWTMPLGHGKSGYLEVPALTKQVLSRHLKEAVDAGVLGTMLQEAASFDEAIEYREYVPTACPHCGAPPDLFTVNEEVFNDRAHQHPEEPHHYLYTYLIIECPASCMGWEWLLERPGQAHAESDLLAAVAEWNALVANMKQTGVKPVTPEEVLNRQYASKQRERNDTIPRFIDHAKAA